MLSAGDPRQIPVLPSATASPPSQLLGARGWWLLVAACGALGMLCALVGCTPSQLKPAETAASWCATVERLAGGAIAKWETDAEAPIVAGAQAATDQAGIDRFKAELAAQRDKYKIAEGCVDGLDFACNALAKSVQIAKDKGTPAIPGDVVDAVLSAVAKLVKTLVDLGVKLPTGLPLLPGTS